MATLDVWCSCMREPGDRRLAAILFTDVVGYSTLMAAEEERGLRVRERHRTLVLPLVEQHRGEAIEMRRIVTEDW